MKISYNVKNNFIFRAAVKPYMDWKRKKELGTYQKSSDSAYIKSLRNSHKGEACVIIGNGPSLAISDLEKLNRLYTFSANRIFELFNETTWRPSCYLAVDNSFIQSSFAELNDFDNTELFIAADLNVDVKKTNKNATRIFEYTTFKINKWNDCTAILSEDVSKFFSVGYTVTFTALQLAMYMGFEKIGLLGVDFNYSVVRDRNGRIHENKDVQDYFFGKKYDSTVLPYYSNLHAFTVAREYADSNGIAIYNLTRGGKLEVFERMSFEEFMRSNETTGFII